MNKTEETRVQNVTPLQDCCLNSKMQNASMIIAEASRFLSLACLKRFKELQSNLFQSLQESLILEIGLRRVFLSATTKDEFSPVLVRFSMDVYDDQLAIMIRLFASRFNVNKMKIFSNLVLCLGELLSLETQKFH